MKKSRRKGEAPRVSLDPGSFVPPAGYRSGSGRHGHQKSFTSTREALHRGHRIKVRTTYVIEIDDEPLTVHTQVMDDGSVHCHGLPNYAFTSAIDMVRAVVDADRLTSYARDDLGGGGDGHDGAHNASHEGDR